MGERLTAPICNRCHERTARRGGATVRTWAGVGVVSVFVSLMLWGCVQVPVDARALINAGYAAALKGDAATTRQHYEKALAAEPGAKGHRVSYGWALFNLKLFDEALQQWRQAYAGVDHDAANIEVCLALACHRTGRKAEALEWYAKQVARDERFGEAAGVAFVTSHWRALEQETLRALFEDFSRRSAPK